MELQSGVPGPLSPGALSPTLDYAAAFPGLGEPGPSHGGPGRAPSPGVSGPAVFNYNQLEGRFKQLQGKRRSLLQTTPPLPQTPFGTCGEVRTRRRRRVWMCMNQRLSFVEAAKRR